MNTQKAGSSSWESQNAKNAIRLSLWTGTWVLTMAIAAFAPRFIWDFSTIPTIVMVLLNVAVGFGMILATAQQIKNSDEMQQKNFLNTAAITLGVGLVFGCSYELLEDIKLIPFEPEISHLLMLMSFTFCVSNVLGHRKYK